MFFFASTPVRSEAEILGFNCAINFYLNIYYVTPNGYTPEVLPSTHRGTGNGIPIGCNRTVGILSAVVTERANVCDCSGKSYPIVVWLLRDDQTNTPVPVYVCAALYTAMAVVAALFPFGPFEKRSS